MSTLKKTLEEQIAERKAEAIKKDINHKATTVANRLGLREGYATGEGSGHEDTYTEATLEIKADDGPPSDYLGGGPRWTTTKVTFEGKVVFELVMGQIKRYIPGAWENRLDTLYQTIVVREVAAPAKAVEKPTSANLAREAEEHEKFGL